MRTSKSRAFPSSSFITAMVRYNSFACSRKVNPQMKEEIHCFQSCHKDSDDQHDQCLSWFTNAHLCAVTLSNSTLDNMLDITNPYIFIKAHLQGVWGLLASSSACLYQTVCPWLSEEVNTYTRGRKHHPFIWQFQGLSKGSLI